MSFAVDVNILVYASDTGSRFSDDAVRFLEERLKATELFYVAWPTVVSYLRLATHPGVLTRPLSHDEAAANIEALLRYPHVRLLSEGEGLWAVYREVTRRTPVRGKLVPDAHLAAILKQHDIRTLYTGDSDFRRFDFLHVVNPLER